MKRSYFPQRGLSYSILRHLVDSIVDWYPEQQMSSWSGNSAAHLDSFSPYWFRKWASNKLVSLFCFVLLLEVKPGQCSELNMIVLIQIRIYSPENCSLTKLFIQCHRNSFEIVFWSKIILCFFYFGKLFSHIILSKVQQPRHLWGCMPWNNMKQNRVQLHWCEENTQTKKCNYCSLNAATHTHNTECKSYWCPKPQKKHKTV